MMSNNNGNNRLSALKRLGKSISTNNNDRNQLVGLNDPPVKDARELLTNRSKTSFDARKLLSRQSSTTVMNNVVRTNFLSNKEDTNTNQGKMIVVTGLKDMKMKDGRLIAAAESNNESEKNKKIFAVGPSTFVTIRNNKDNASATTSSLRINEKPTLTKTINNPSVRVQNDVLPSQTGNDLQLFDRKVAVSIVNDKFQKAPQVSQRTTTTSSSSTSSSSLSQQNYPPPLVKRLLDASIQTMPSSSSSSRSPIRMNSHRRHTTTSIDDEDHTSYQAADDDSYEPPIKRTTLSTRKTTATATTATEKPTVSTGSVKRTSTGTPVSSRITSSASTVSKTVQSQLSNSVPGTILVTNLQLSVTEEDVIELFGEVGRIAEITTLSQGCVQIVYAKREDAEKAVAKYHNRLLDGQFMYVSLQQSVSYSTEQTSKSTSNVQQPTKENGATSSSTTTNDQPLKFNLTNDSSKKQNIDPAFIRQALFHPTNNTANPVQFQVKL